MEFSRTNLDVGQMKKEKFKILPNNELHTYTDQPALLHPWGQGDNDALGM
jgi:hypothetical protein